MFYFLKTDSFSSCYAAAGKKVNLGDGERLQVPCQLIITGQRKFVQILKEKLLKSKATKFVFLSLFGSIIRLSELSEDIFPRNIKEYLRNNKIFKLNGIRIPQ